MGRLNAKIANLNLKINELSKDSGINLKREL